MLHCASCPGARVGTGRCLQALPGLPRALEGAQSLQRWSTNSESDNQALGTSCVCLDKRLPSWGLGVLMGHVGVTVCSTPFLCGPAGGSAVTLGESGPWARASEPGFAPRHQGTMGKQLSRLALGFPPACSVPGPPWAHQKWWVLRALSLCAGLQGPA